MKVLIRPARTKDYDDVSRLTAAAYLHDGFLDPEDDYVHRLTDAAHRDRHGHLWVAELDHQVVGAVTVTAADGEYADIALSNELEFRMLAVDPRVQRAGIGRALVQAVIEHARTTAGITAVSLSSAEFMSSAHRLYASMGFARVPERDWAVPGLDIGLLVFVLDLPRNLPDPVPTR